MDDVPRQEVDVVVAERNPGIADALPVKKVQLAVVQPDGALKKIKGNFSFPSTKCNLAILELVARGQTKSTVFHMKLNKIQIQGLS